MHLDNVKVRAEPYFYEATCPKCNREMLELQNGWLSVAWFCERCQVAFHLVMRKMQVTNEDALAEAVARAKAKRRPG